MTRDVKNKQRVIGDSQQGVAIITVLLIIAMMMTLIGFLVEEQYLLIRRITNQRSSESAYHISQGVTIWAKRVLREDANRNIDHLNEDWAKFGKPPPPDGENNFSLDLTSQKDKKIPKVDFGITEMKIGIVDLQSRYNLNNLSNPDKAYVTQQSIIFKNILQLAGVDEFDLQNELLGALLDWMDENDLRGANGAESGDYRGYEPPYFASDQRLSSLGELRYVKGFTLELINKISPYVTVLPVDNAKLNLNTVDANVLLSLSSSPIEDRSPVTSLLALRNEEGFLGFNAGQIRAAENAIIRSSPIRKVPIRDMIQVNSEYFQVNTSIPRGSAKYCIQTKLIRRIPDSNKGVAEQLRAFSRQVNPLCNEDLH